MGWSFRTKKEPQELLDMADDLEAEESAEEPPEEKPSSPNIERWRHKPLELEVLTFTGNNIEEFVGFVGKNYFFKLRVMNGELYKDNGGTLLEKIEKGHLFAKNTDGYVHHIDRATLAFGYDRISD